MWFSYFVCRAPAEDELSVSIKVHEIYLIKGKSYQNCVIEVLFEKD